MKFKDMIIFGKEMLRDKIVARKRGKNESTIYLLVPKKYREHLEVNKELYCGIVNGDKGDWYLVVKIKSKNGNKE